MDDSGGLASYGTNLDDLVPLTRIRLTINCDYD